MRRAQRGRREFHESMLELNTLLKWLGFKKIRAVRFDPHGFDFDHPGGRVKTVSVLLQSGASLQWIKADIGRNVVNLPTQKDDG